MSNCELTVRLPLLLLLLLLRLLLKVLSLVCTSCAFLSSCGRVCR